MRRLTLPAFQLADLLAYFFGVPFNAVQVKSWIQKEQHQAEKWVEIEIADMLDIRRKPGRARRPPAIVYRAAFVKRYERGDRDRVSVQHSQPTRTQVEVRDRVQPLRPVLPSASLRSVTQFPSLKPDAMHRARSA